MCLCANIRLENIFLPLFRPNHSMTETYFGAESEFLGASPEVSVSLRFLRNRGVMSAGYEVALLPKTDLWMKASEPGAHA